MRAADRGDANSPLASRILRELRMRDWDQLQLRVYRAPDEVFPRIFPVVAAAADEGDSMAQALLDEAACALAGLVADLVARLQIKSTKALLVKTGGMNGRSKYFDRRLDEQLRAAAPNAEIGQLAMTAAEAAAHMALKLSVRRRREA
jgi:N-acetylglucosamine kinase-like BadF-type ATPase